MGVGKQIANNVIWKYLELVSVTGIQLITTFVMARFLTRVDYGIMGLVTVFTAIANVFVDSGFGQALIREKSVTREDYSTIFYFNLLISLVLYVVLYFSSGTIATLFNQPILENVCKVTFWILPLNALSLVQITKMQRELKFKKLCLVSITALFLSSLIAIYIVYLYRNIWALVFFNISIYFFKTLLLWLTTNFVPIIRFSISSLKKYTFFSKNLLASAFVATVFNNIYSVVIGRSYSTAELGLYSQAERLKNLTSQTATQVIQSVTYPFLSKMNNENEDIKEAYKKIIAVALIFVGFIMTILMGCSLDLFELLMGSSEWRSAGFYFMLMGVNGILYPLHSINQNIIMVKGDSKTVFRLEVFRRFVMILIVLITINYDIVVFVFGITIYSIMLLFINLYYCGRPIQYGVYEQLKDTFPIFLRLFIMITVSLGTTFLIKSFSLPLRLSVTLSVGVITGILLFRNQKDFRNILKLILLLANKK